METKQIVTTVASLVSVIGVIVLILGTLAYFNIWTLSYIGANGLSAMIGGLVLLIIGAVGAWYATSKM